MQKNFGNTYEISIHFPSIERFGNTATTISNLTYLFSNNKLSLIEIKDEVFSITIKVVYHAIQIEIFRLQKRVDLTLEQQKHIVRQIKFIALQLERNPNLWFSDPKEMLDPD